MTPKFIVAASAAAFLLISAWPVQAQTNRIAGVVRDETGGPIRGAIVRAETTATASAAPVTLTAATDDRGRFVFIVNRSREWRLTFEAPGFDPTTVVTSVRLTGAAPNLAVKLERHEAPEQSGAMAGIDIKLLQTQLAAAAAMLDEGRYDQAIVAYRDLRIKAPALTLVNLQLGIAYLMQKSYAEAEAAFQEILTADANDPNGLFAMGSAKEAEGNAEQARSFFQRASSADPFWTRPLMKLASLARAAGDRTSAGKYLTQVIAIDPGSPDAVQAQSIQKQLQ